MAASACANLEWLGAAATTVPPATMALAPLGVKHVSAAPRELSEACVKEPVGSVPAGLGHLDFAVTVASVASGDSLVAGRVSAMGMQMNATLAQELAWVAEITQGVTTVKGAWLASTGIPGSPMGASAGPVLALKALEANGTLLLLATVMGTPNRSGATARLGTQDCGVMLVPLGTLVTHRGLEASASHANAVETSTPRILRPVTHARGSACAVYTTQRGHIAPTANLASMGRLPGRAVAAAPVICWAQIPGSVRPPTNVTVTQILASAHAFPTSRALAATAVPPTFGTLQAAMAANLVPAT